MVSSSTSHLRTNTTPLTTTLNRSNKQHPLNIPQNMLLEKSRISCISGISSISKISNYPDKKHPSQKKSFIRNKHFYNQYNSSPLLSTYDILHIQHQFRLYQQTPTITIQISILNKKVDHITNGQPFGFCIPLKYLPI